MPSSPQHHIRKLTDADNPTWHAYVGDTLAGTAVAYPGSGTKAQFVRLSVEPEHRRQGIGTDLLRALGTGLRASGCEVIETIVLVGSDGEAFAAKHGAAVGDELVDDVLEFSQLDVEDLRTLAGAIPPGYTLAHWSRSAPDDLVASYAHAKRFIADAPNAYPPAIPDWNSALVRELERVRAERGATLWVNAIVVEDTDRVAAYSEISTDASAHAGQEDTAVLPQHRRHGLATCLKADLVLRVHAARPDLDTLSVTCAAANTGMRAVNHRLGFREARRRNLVRLPLDLS